MTEIHERLKEARRAAGYATATEAARRFGWAPPTYLGHENGSGGIRRKMAERYAQAFRVSLEWLLTGQGPAARKGVPIVGYVGAGSEIYPIDDHEKGDGLDLIDPPPGAGPSAVAVRVRGDSQYPAYRDGDLLVYEAHLPPDEAAGRECIVSLADGRKMVKTVRRGREDGLFNLESHNAPLIESVQVEWAAPILWVRKSF